jgi:broad specificity phosphatase PhoE
MSGREVAVGETGGKAHQPARVVLVRHGQTEWSANGRHTGWTDMPLTEEGRRQAELVGSRLRGEDFAAVLSSPLSRALDTARIAGFGDRVEVDDDLREWNYGQYEGRRSKEIRAERPGWEIWRDGVVGGETLDQVAGRMDRVLRRIGQVHGNVAVFGHAHALRVLAARWLDLPPYDGGRLVLAPATMSVLGWDRDRRVIVRWNDASHFEAEWMAGTGTTAP